MATDLERLNRTLEEDSKGKGEATTSLADEIMAELFFRPYQLIPQGSVISYPLADLRPKYVK